jgi:hypothetical protein
MPSFFVLVSSTCVCLYSVLYALINACTMPIVVMAMAKHDKAGLIIHCTIIVIIVGIHEIGIQNDKETKKVSVLTIGGCK